MSAPAEGASGAGWLFERREAERLYRTYAGLVADAVAWKLSGVPKEEVEEVVSSVWAKLFEANGARLRSFRGRNGASFATWLSKVAKNAARDYLRAKRLVSVPLDWSGEDGREHYSIGELLKDRSPDPLERLVARETRKEVMLAVKGLPKIYRQAVYARFYRAWSVPDAAAVFGIDEDTVYVRLARAFAKLRKELGRRGVFMETDPKRPRPAASSTDAASRSGPCPAAQGRGRRPCLSDKDILMLLDRPEAWERARSGPLAAPCRSCLDRMLRAALLWELLSEAGSARRRRRPCLN